MHETLKLFDYVINNKWLARASIILFLNKKDLFEIKIKTRPLSICFPDFDGENSYEIATKFIRSKFKLLMKHSQRHENQFFSHLTCATDSENIKAVINCVYSTIADNMLNEIGLL